MFLDAGAAQVIAVEAAPETYSVLCQNLANTGAIALNAAVAAKAGTATINVHVGRYQYSNSIVISSSKRVGVEVPAVTLTGLFAEYRPTVLKCDVEFAEHQLTELYALPAEIRALQIEIHYGQQENPEFRASGQRLTASFAAQGFTCLRMTGRSAHAWNSEQTWVRS